MIPLDWVKEAMNVEKKLQTPYGLHQEGRMEGLGLKDNVVFS